jgi:hypothetical protein
MPVQRQAADMATFYAVDAGAQVGIGRAAEGALEGDLGQLVVRLGGSTVCFG